LRKASTKTPLKSTHHFDDGFASSPLDLMPKCRSTSTVASDGLRYTFKGGGSPFKDSANMGTMSCYRCGLHKPRALGSFTRFLNQRTFVCQACTAQPKKSPA
jgi:hypothetical protein